MKHIGFVLCTLLIFMFCSTKTIQPDKKKEIALATLQQSIQFYNTGQYIPALKKL